MAPGLRIVLAGLAAPLALTVAVGAAWALDMQSFGGEVVRNTTLARTPVGGLDARQLEGVVARVDDALAGSTVEVTTPNGRFELGATEIGLRVDHDETTEAVLDLGRTGGVAGRAARWLGSFFDTRRAPVVVTVDAGALHRLVAERDPARTGDPREPSIAVRNGQVVAVAGRSGRGTAPLRVLAGIAEAAERGEHPLRVAVEPGPVPPRFPVEDAERVADRANALTTAGVDVRAGELSATVPAETLRSWTTARTAQGGLVLGIDGERAVEGLAELLPEAGVAPVDARFEVQGGRVVIIRGRLGAACCGDTAGDLLLDAIVNPGTEPVVLPLRSVEPELTSDEARQLGVVEPIAEATTRHRAGEARVRNIHRIADIIRGQLVPPGGSFSVNGFVGPRTRDKGFVPAGVIYDGEFTEDVGGGISQFATTLFNAVFFAGLDFEEYQSHSIYISRYPYGREATLSYPKPDLVFSNPTDHGVLIWPTYTQDTITVTLWSTKTYEVTQSGQRRAPAGSCTRVTTERTRHEIATGDKQVDRVFALYRPEEGVDC